MNIKQVDKGKSLTQCLTHDMDLLISSSVPSFSYPLHGEMPAMWRSENQFDHFSFTGFLLGVPYWLIAGAMGGTILFLETCLLGSPWMAEPTIFLASLFWRKLLGTSSGECQFYLINRTLLLREQFPGEHFLSNYHSLHIGRHPKCLSFLLVCTTFWQGISCFCKDLGQFSSRELGQSPSKLKPPMRLCIVVAVW